MKKGKNFLKILLIFVASIVVGFIFSSVGGSMHNSIWPSHGCEYWGPCDIGSKFEGFIYFYMLILVFMSFVLLRRKIAFWVFTIGSSLFWIYYILLLLVDDLDFLLKEDYGTLGIMLGASVLGFVLAMIVNYVRKKYLTKKVENTIK